MAYTVYTYEKERKHIAEKENVLLKFLKRKINASEPNAVVLLGTAFSVEDHSGFVLI